VRNRLTSHLGLRNPTGRTPDRANARPGERSITRSLGRSHARSGERPNAAARRRQARRYSFEIYEDQIERIKRLALENQLRGGDLNISVIARRALDLYLDSLEASA
jgi:hypothetical protein